MRRFFLATTILFSASMAHAADMDYKAPIPRAAPVAIFTWTGFYLGANAGIGGDKVDYPFNALAGAVTGNIGMQSFGGFAGGQGGYNYQLGGSGIVLGVEADIQWSNIRSNTTASVSVPAAPITAALNAGTEIKWFGTARGRFGYTITPQALLYATGGYAYGSEDTTANVTVNGTPIARGLPFSRTANLSGYVVGGGLEYAFAPNWSAKTEYLFFDFGKRNVFTAATPGVFAIDNNIKMHTLKFGLNYSFR